MHRRVVGQDFRNRADHMPWDESDPAADPAGDTYLRKLPKPFTLMCPPGGSNEFLFADDFKILQLGVLGRDLSKKAEEGWRQRRSREHIDTWTKEKWDPLEDHA